MKEMSEVIDYLKKEFNLSKEEAESIKNTLTEHTDKLLKDMLEGSSKIKNPKGLLK